METADRDTKKKGIILRLMTWGINAWDYFNRGVWDDPRHNWWVGLVKTLNLSMRSFLNSRLWIRAAALTYSTVLAIVPALALVFAICRGFGFQNLLEEQLLHYFPAQSQVISFGLKFVDSYLSSSSEGVFVGVGIIFLLYTLISLVGNVEDAFNEAWSVHRGRTFWRKITDYTAIFLILPILMICSSGITIVMSTTLQNILPWPFLKSAISWLLDLASLGLIWMFFTGTYMLIPNTRVKFRNAVVAGFFAGLGFVVLQWLFVTGQLYVARYNAIYGSFSFLPLLLLWLQLVWLLTLAGAVVCYALQNIYNLSYINKVDNISIAYRERVALAVMTVIVRRFADAEPALTLSQISRMYRLPANLVSIVVEHLVRCNLVDRISPKADYIEPGLVPSLALSHITVGEVLNRLNNNGDSGFIPEFDDNFAALNEVFDTCGVNNSTLLSDIKINNDNKIS